jgi:hypothetical protein
MVCHIHGYAKKKLEETKKGIRNRKSKKASNDLQNTSQKPKDRAKRTPLKHGDGLLNVI